MPGKIFANITNITLSENRLYSDKIMLKIWGIEEGFDMELAGKGI